MMGITASGDHSPCRAGKQKGDGQREILAFPSGHADFLSEPRLEKIEYWSGFPRHKPRAKDLDRHIKAPGMRTAESKIFPTHVFHATHRLQNRKQFVRAAFGDLAQKGLAVGEALIDGRRGGAAAPAP